MDHLGTGFFWPPLLRTLNHFESQFVPVVIASFVFGGFQRFFILPGDCVAMWV